MTLINNRSKSQINQIKNILPADVQITVEKMNPSILPVMGYSLQSSTSDQVELKMIAEYIIKPYISRIKGISSVEIIGGKVKEYRIIPDEQKLSLLKISTQQIYNTLQQTGFIKANGYIIDYNRLYLTVTDADVKNKQQLENLILFDNGISRIKISDVATVQISERNEYVRIKADGKNVPLVAVLKQPQSNLIDVATQVTEKVQELNKILA